MASGYSSSRRRSEAQSSALPSSLLARKLAARWVLPTRFANISNWGPPSHAVGLSSGRLAAVSARRNVFWLAGATLKGAANRVSGVNYELSSVLMPSGPHRWKEPHSPCSSHSGEINIRIADWMRMTNRLRVCPELHVRLHDLRSLRWMEARRRKTSALRLRHTPARSTGALFFSALDALAADDRSALLARRGFPALRIGCGQAFHPTPSQALHTPISPKALIVFRSLCPTTAVILGWRA